jgi:hypothetical protein
MKAKVNHVHRRVLLLAARKRGLPVTAAATIAELRAMLGLPTYGRKSRATTGEGTGVPTRDADAAGGQEVACRR